MCVIYLVHQTGLAHNRPMGISLNKLNIFLGDRDRPVGTDSDLEVDTVDHNVHMSYFSKQTS